MQDPRKSTNMDTLVTGTLNQLFIRGSSTQFFFLIQKNKVVSGKALLFVIGPFCTPHSICVNMGL